MTTCTFVHHLVRKGDFSPKHCENDIFGVKFSYQRGCNPCSPPSKTRQLHLLIWMDVMLDLIYMTSPSCEEREPSEKCNMEIYLLWESNQGRTPRVARWQLRPLGHTLRNDEFKGLTQSWHMNKINTWQYMYQYDY